MLRMHDTQSATVCCIAIDCPCRLLTGAVALITPTEGPHCSAPPPRLRTHKFPETFDTVKRSRHRDGQRSAS